MRAGRIKPLMTARQRAALRDVASASLDLLDQREGFATIDSGRQVYLTRSGVAIGLLAAGPQQAGDQGASADAVQRALLVTEDDLRRHRRDRVLDALSWSLVAAMALAAVLLLSWPASPFQP